MTSSSRRHIALVTHDNKKVGGDCCGWQPQLRAQAG
jgi:methylglyoxal synthase